MEIHNFLQSIKNQFSLPHFSSIYKYPMGHPSLTQRKIFGILTLFLKIRKGSDVLKEKLTRAWQLFVTFFKIGAFTFGGGYAMIPIIQKEAVEKRNWVTDDDILEIIAIAESTPGPIAINSATFVGYRTCGVLGAACATFGVVLPSFVVILIISYVLQQFQNIQAVQYAFNGIRAGVLALLFKALWSMYQKSPKGWVSYVVMAGAFVAAAFLKVNVLFIVIGCALFGLITALIAERRAKK